MPQLDSQDTPSALYIYDLYCLYGQDCSLQYCSTANVELWTLYQLFSGKSDEVSPCTYAAKPLMKGLPEPSCRLLSIPSTASSCLMPSDSSCSTSPRPWYLPPQLIRTSISSLNSSSLCQSQTQWKNVDKSQ